MICDLDTGTAMEKLPRRDGNLSRADQRVTVILKCTNIGWRFYHSFAAIMNNVLE